MGNRPLTPRSWTMANSGRLSMTILRLLPFSFTDEAETKMTCALCLIRQPIHTFSYHNLACPVFCFSEIVSLGRRVSETPRRGHGCGKRCASLVYGQFRLFTQHARSRGHEWVKYGNGIMACYLFSALKSPLVIAKHFEVGRASCRGRE